MLWSVLSVMFAAADLSVPMSSRFQRNIQSSHILPFATKELSVQQSLHCGNVRILAQLITSE